ncbi:hypothetical protein FOJ82_15815 [Tessaracoccus rhinocerotis]|uniref:Tetratricopeptide repeat protein n=1 Tax=Tessaracoccus rhinocerotis TaxID=1689449 RepID=A0A553JW04_9ACTN|nr:hypothetical protein [Tessaracoccus rhinocerotis]TRY16647.1 hypothetical protein FOJ82_15815 [Tessaracoccus rhinocerotis]
MGGFRGTRRDDSGRGGDDRRPPRDEEYVPRPGTARAVDEPDTPTDFDSALLPAGVRAELRGLPKELANIVGAHIQAAGELIDVDPELAFKHAEAARRRAGRIPIVREAAAETAYAAGHYDVALREYRAIRRMNGGDEFIPVMADCERALGRPRDALELLASLDPQTKNIGLRIECLLVEAGVRDDLGQRGEAMRLLEEAISHKVGPKLGQARLRYAYAEFLLEEGQQAEARRWFEAAEKLDGESELDVTDRIAAIDGIILPEDFDLDSDEEDAPGVAEEDSATPEEVPSADEDEPAASQDKRSETAPEDHGAQELDK